MKSGKIKFQVVEHLVDGRRIRKSVGLENVDPTNRGLLSETRLIAKTKQNSYQRPKRKLDAKQIEADIRWHKRRADAWSKNPDKRHLVEGERQQIMHLQNQLKDIT